MKAAVFHDQADIRVEDVPEPVCGSEELLLESRAVGICGTDAHEFASGPHMFPIHERHPVAEHLGPMIPGHEFAGVVREVGKDVNGFEVGDLVVSGAGISCGKCVQCRRGRTNLCVAYSTVGLQRHGGLAQYVTAPASTCFRVAPYGLSADTAALAQPMSIAVHAMRRGRLEASDQAVIVGAGGIGAFLTFAAVNTTPDVVVLDLDEDRLKIADNLGARHTLQLQPDTDLAAALARWGMEPTVVYEVSGTRGGLETARSILPPGGRLVLVGLQSQPIEWDVRRFSLVEHELIGTNAHVAAQDMPRALELLAARKTPWTDIAPTALPLEELVEQGLRPIVERRSTRIKTLIDPWATRSRPTRPQDEYTGSAAAAGR